MASGSYQQLRDEIRTAFRDTLKTMFADEGLDAVIDEAQREYAALSGALTSSVEVSMPFGGGPCVAPQDFIRPVRLVGTDGNDIPEFSRRYLEERHGDWRLMEGRHPRGVCYDGGYWGQFRIIPGLPEYAPVGVLHYVRFPKEGVLEVEDTEALREYALYVLSVYSGKPQALGHLGNFTRLANVRANGARSIYANTRGMRNWGSYF